MTRDYMNMGSMLIVFDHYMRQSIEVAGEYMANIRQLKALELLGLIDLSNLKDANYACAMCEVEAARSAVGHAYTHHLIDVEDFQTINRGFNKFGLTEQEVKS